MLKHSSGSVAWLKSLLTIGLIMGSISLVIPPQVEALTARGPILIDGNAGFTPENGVTGGGGTSSDPYIIQGWEISTVQGGEDKNGISIEGTDADFIIRNVYIHLESCSGSCGGISLWNVANGGLENLLVSYTSLAVFMIYSSNISVIGSDFSSTSFGMLIRDSNRVVVSGSNLSTSSHMGADIFVANSSEVSLSANSLSRGIHFAMRDTSLSQLDSYAITPDNLVNGKPLYYHKDCRDLTVDGITVGQLMIVNCERVRIANLQITNARLGVGVYYSDNVTLSDNEISRNHYGIEGWVASHVSILRNNIRDNDIMGTAIHWFDGLEISENNFQSNPQWGIGLFLSSNFAIMRNSVSNGVGIPGQTLGVGIALGSCSNGVVSDNRLSNNTYGIQMDEGCTNVTVTRNRISGNQKLGILVGDPSGTSTAINAAPAGMTESNSLSLAESLSRPLIYHNNLVENRVQALDLPGQNSWDAGYPLGGNYWSNYEGTDSCSGPDQNTCNGPDGIGDTPFAIDSDNFDRYPLISPVQVTGPADCSGTLVFTPTDDAYIMPYSSSDVNFGSAAQLIVDSSPKRDFLLKFNVTGLESCNVASAKLRLFQSDSSNRGGDFRTTVSAWSESTVTWNNAPVAAPSVIASLGSVSAGRWYEVDIASAVTGDGVVSLRVTSSSSDGAFYSSKEGANPPQLVVTLSSTRPPTTSLLTFSPTDDAYIMPYSSSDSNFGSDSRLIVDASPRRDFLLKFTVTGVETGLVLSAKLRLFQADSSPRGGDFCSTSTGWSEGTVTWNNAPACQTTTIASLGSVSANNWYEVDVTGVVTGDGTVSFRISSPNSDGAFYSSKEGANPPQLVITVSG